VRACSVLLNTLLFDSKITAEYCLKLRNNGQFTAKLIVLEGKYHFGENVSSTFHLGFEQ